MNNPFSRVKLFEDKKPIFHLEVGDNDDFLIRLKFEFEKSRMSRLYFFIAKMARQNMKFEDLEKENFEVPADYLKFFEARLSGVLIKVQKEVNKEKKDFKILSSQITKMSFEKLEEKKYLATIEFKGVCNA